jgi:hypothetical protein
LVSEEEELAATRKASAPPETGRHIPIPIHDKVRVSDDVKRQLTPHFDALIYELAREGFDEEVAELERMRDKVLAP